VSELQQEKSSGTLPRRPGAARDASVGDPLLEGNPYFGNEVRFYTNIDMLLNYCMMLHHCSLTCCSQASFRDAVANSVSYCCASLVCMLLLLYACCCMLFLLYGCSMSMLLHTDAHLWYACSCNVAVISYCCASFACMLLLLHGCSCSMSMLLHISGMHAVARMLL